MSLSFMIRDLAIELHFGAGPLAEQIRSAFFTSQGLILPLFIASAGAAEDELRLPCGFSLCRCRG